MRHYAPFYLWAVIAVVLAFGVGIRVGSAHGRYEDVMHDTLSLTPHLFHPPPGFFYWLHE
jgi:hypothetical protein